MKEKNINLIKFSITGIDIEDKSCTVEDQIFELIKANDNIRIGELFKKNKNVVVVDYTEAGCC